MTKIIVSNFNECEYNLTPFGFNEKTFLVIEEGNLIYIRTSNDNYLLKNDLIFINDELNLLKLNEDQKLIIKEILESNVNTNNKSIIEEEEVFDEMSGM